MDITLNWLAIAVVTVLSFLMGNLWFGPLFGKNWMRIVEMDKMSKNQEKDAMKGMWKLMISELVATFLMIVGLACVVAAIPEYSGIRNALMLWL